MLLLLLLCSLSPYIYLSFFAHPAADDYCYSLWSMQKPFLENFTHLFQTTGGRYTTNALLLVNPLKFNNLTLYKTIPVLMILFTVLSVYYLFRSVTSCAISKVNSLNASILFVLLYLHQMPSLAEGIYFYNSAVDYHLGLIMTVFYFGLLHEYLKRKFILHPAVHLILLLIVLVISLGFNEVITLALMCFHGVVLFLFNKQQKKISTDWMMVALVCLVFSCIMLLAPGNSVRAENYSDNHNLFRSLSFTGMQMFRFGFSWASSLPLILSSFLFAGIVISKKEKMPFFGQKYFISPWMSVLLLLGVLFLGIFPPYWATNILGQHRTVNMVCFLFLLYWFVCIGMYANNYSEKIKVNFIIGQKTRLIMIGIILCMITATNNGYTVMTDILYGKVNTFEREMQERYRLLNNPENKNKTVRIKALSEKPGSLFILDIYTDSTYWVNSCEADYFGVKQIVCAE